MQPRVPTRQCHPVFLPWLQPGGANLGPRACALAVTPTRVRAVVMRLEGWTPVFALVLATPRAPVPIRSASALPATAMDNPAAAAVRTNRFLHMDHLLL